MEDVDDEFDYDDKNTRGVRYEESSIEDYGERVEFTLVDIRCDKGPRELLMRLEVNEVIPVGPWNLMHLKCSWCTRMGRKQDPTVKRVIHKYNLLGEFCGSDIERN